MATLEQFRQVRASTAPEVETELHSLLLHDLDAAVEKMIRIGTIKGVIFTPDEALFYLKILHDEGELDDVKIDNSAIASIKNDASYRNEKKATMRAARKRLWNPGTRQMARAVNLLARLNRLKAAAKININSTASKDRGKRIYVISSS